MTEKKNRTLEIFFRAMRGEDLSPARLAESYDVSTKSITRSINEIKDFLAENRELVGHTELVYAHANKAYRLFFDEFFSDKELFAIAKVIIGSRAFSGKDISLLMSKLKRFVSIGDRKKLDEIIRRELYHFSEIKHDCENVINTLWQLISVINDKKEITINYYKVDRTMSEKRIQPVSLMFSEYYFYLIAYYPDKYDEPRYFRVDRITNIVEHRKRFCEEHIPGFDEGELRRRAAQPPSFDEGALRRKNQYMFFGKLRRIRFWYSGPSLQAVLDKLPTAKIIEHKRSDYLLEAEVYGDGIKMFLLSQGTWVKVIAPEEFVKEIGDTARRIAELYKEGDA
jgi:predicted DNA-binding transcriptional regulator YafY